MINLKSYVLAGNATFTLENQRSGKRITYRVRQPEEASPHFVSVLTGQSNEDDYTFLGSIFQAKEFRHGKRSSITPEAPSAQGFAWLFRHLNDLEHFPHVRFVPSGKCCRCGRKLTTPESVDAGIGPECTQKGGL